MSATEDKVKERVTEIMTTPWQVRDGQVVPRSHDVVMKDQAVKLHAAYLYSDLCQSTLIAKRYEPLVAARIIRSFLVGVCNVIRAKGGHIRSFDGDRVMAVFIGDAKRTNAVNAALGISWVMDKQVTPAIQAALTYEGLESWSITHRTGVDVGEAMMVRGGVRDSSDLVSIGRAPNIAAKLSEMKQLVGQVRVTGDVMSGLNDVTKVSDGGDAMFTDQGQVAIGPHSIRLYTSGWMRRP